MENATDLRATLRSEIKLRERLNDLAPFGAAGQAILLDLALCRIEGRRACITDACIAAFGRPHTSGLRYVTQLQQAGLITRTDDWNDRRLGVLSITEEGFARVAAVFQPA